MLRKEVAMSIQLTPQQQQALDTQKESPARVIDPRTNTTYILVPEVDFESSGTFWKTSVVNRPFTR
jgi:hypothetical protein